MFFEMKEIVCSLIFVKRMFKGPELNMQKFEQIEYIQYVEVSQ